MQSRPVRSAAARCFRALSFLFPLIFAAALPAATLVKNGQPTAVLALSEAPNDPEKLAAKELVAHVEKMSGAKLEITTVNAADVGDFLAKSKAAGRVPIFLGRNVRERLRSNCRRMRSAARSRSRSRRTRC